MTAAVRTVASCRVCGSERAEFVFATEGFELVRCEECDLVYVANPPTAGELDSLYSFDSSYHQAFLHDEQEAAARAMLARRYLDWLERQAKPPGRVLDVGCSAGFFLTAARDAGWDAVGVELSPDTASIARERYGHEVHVGTLEEVDLPPGSFDAVTLWDVIEHVPDPRATLARANALLRPGGVIAMITPNIDGLFPRTSYKLANRLDWWPHPEPPAHLFQFSERTLSGALRRTGFEPVEFGHKRIPLGYTFGRREVLMHSRKRAAYAAVFAPLALLGPLFRAGDKLYATARKVAQD